MQATTTKPIERARSQRRLRWSLATKIAALSVGIAVATALVYTVFELRNVERLSDQKSIDKLTGNTQLLVPYVDAEFNNMYQDLQILKSTPPVQGLARTNSRIADPLDGSSYSSWKMRLETIFASVLQAREGYTQIRYIGVANGGRELVRVDRVHGLPKAVPADELQSKGAEPYFQQAVGLQPGEWMFSDVTRNVEHGIVQYDDPVTIRALSPVFAANGKLFGILIINEDYKDLFDRVVGKVAVDSDLLIVDDNRNFFYAPAGGESRLVLWEESIEDPLRGLVDRITTAAPDKQLLEYASGHGRRVLAYRHARTGLGPQRTPLRITLSGDKKHVYAEATAIKRTNFAIALLLVVLASMVSLMAARWLVGPLNAMRRALDGYARGEDLSGLPLHLDDEIGDFARSFQALNDKRNAAKNKLKHFAAELEESNQLLSSTIGRLNAANSDLRDFTYIVSHDLRAPLINLVGFSGELRRSMENLKGRITGLTSGPIPEELSDLLDRRIPTALSFIDTAGTKMQSHLDIILGLSRLGWYELKPVPLQLQELFQNVVVVHVGENDRETVQIRLDDAPEVVIDEEALRIIATNLISNALKYRDEARPLSVTVSAEWDNDHVTLCVEDSGRGIREQDREEIFKLFRRVGKQNTQGEGIGLSYCRRVAERVNGRIWCEPGYVVGTRFLVRIPRHGDQCLEKAA